LQLYLTGKHLKVVPRLREHLEKHLEKLNQYDPGIISAHVVLKTEKFLNIAEVTIKAGHFEFYGEGSGDDNMFSAIDLAINRVEAQLKKHREKMKEARKRSPKEQAAVEKASSGLEPEIVSSSSFAPERLTVQDASFKLAKGDQDFLIYKDTKSKKVNVIYKRPDGQHGVIEPEL
jgi:putative sigma-54 modulation protein